MRLVSRCSSLSNLTPVQSRNDSSVEESEAEGGDSVTYPEAVKAVVHHEREKVADREGNTDHAAKAIH